MALLRRGNKIVFSFDISNNSQEDLTGLTGHITLPKGVSFETYNSTQGVLNSLIWNIGTLKAGSFATINISTIKTLDLKSYQASVIYLGDNLDASISNNYQTDVFFSNGSSESEIGSILAGATENFNAPMSGTVSFIPCTHGKNQVKLVQSNNLVVNYLDSDTGEYNVSWVDPKQPGYFLYTVWCDGVQKSGPSKVNFNPLFTKEFVDESSEAIQTKLGVDDTSSVNLTLSGDGKDVTPYNISADVIISPADKNALRNDGNGLFVKEYSLILSSISEVFTNVVSGNSLTLTGFIPNDSSLIQVFYNGIKQIEGVNYTISSDKVISSVPFTTEPVNSIEVVKFKSTSITSVSETFNNKTTGDTITVTEPIDKESLVFVYGDGIKKINTVDYNISSQDITFTTTFDEGPYNKVEVVVFKNL